MLSLSLSLFHTHTHAYTRLHIYAIRVCTRAHATARQVHNLQVYETVWADDQFMWDGHYGDRASAFRSTTHQIFPR
jgi:hypothetical protein